MACPMCGCKTTYTYDDGDECAMQSDDSLERCAACGHIFDIEDGLYEDDDEPMDDATRYALGAM